MKPQTIFAVLFIMILLFSCSVKNSKKTINASDFIEAPDAFTKDSIFSEHGLTRNDPYFWMRLSDEQKNASIPDDQTKQVLDYLEAENTYTNEVLKETESFQGKLYNEIVGRIKQNDESVPYYKNGYWYYLRYKEKSEYAIYCRKKESLDSNEEIYLDANERAEGQDYYDESGITISKNNKILCFSEDTLSRRVYTFRFKNLETGEFYRDEIHNTDGNGAWANDNITFFYTTKNEVSLLPNKIWKHKLGESVDKDVLVYEEKDPSFYIGVTKSKSNKYIEIWNGSTVSSDYHLIDAGNPDSELRNFTPREDVHEYNIAHFKDKFYILTNWNATNFRLMETPANATSKENWKEVVAHRNDVLITNLAIFKEHLVLCERENALTNLRIINQKNGEEHYLEFDEPAYVAEISNNPEFDSDLLRFAYSSMTTPFSTYDYKMDERTKELKKQQEVVGGHNPLEYTTERLFANSRDGKKIPISLVYKKGFKKNGNAPMLLYAYGSYGFTIDPYFNSTRLSLLDRGFVFAIAHLRGSEALGRQWYDDGKMFNKKNTFNDYVDCTKYLINEKYSSSEHIYAMGGSAGGLLMGAIANIAPEFYNGIIAKVPFVDVISTMLDETIPLTTNEFNEWGNPKNKASYDYMLSYSPYDNVAATNYPHMLVTTGLFDSQVQYWEPAKWVAKLRDMKTDNNLLLLNCNMDAGHGGTSGRFKRYKEVALEYVYMFYLEGITK